MKNIAPKGFTLVELMVAVLAGSIVLIGAGYMLVSGQIFWNKAWQKANLQRDASYAMQRISRSLKAGSSAEMLDGGQALKIYQQADEIEFYFDGTGKDFKCRINGGQPRIILDGNVEGLQFKVEVNKVQIGLRLCAGDLQTQMTSTVMLRNYEG